MLSCLAGSSLLLASVMVSAKFTSAAAGLHLLYLALREPAASTEETSDPGGKVSSSSGFS